MSKSNKKLVSKKSRKVKSVPPAISVGRSGTKSSIILQLLNQGDGATVTSLAQATGWQEHSVRGFMSGTLKKKQRLDIASKVVNGVRHYSLREGKPG
jgi:hypothetical protein